MRILVGSQAARHWWPNYRAPHDTDYFLPTGETLVRDASTVGKVESFWDEAFTASEQYLLSHCVFDKSEGVYQFIASPDFLYTLKVSHAFWVLRNGSWNKHMHDIAWMQQNTEAKFVQGLYDIFYPVWKERYGAKRARLDVSADEFFTASVERIYDHDSIHASVAYYDKPLFNAILKDGEEVMVDRRKFEALDHGDKLRLVREECYATALERIIIPKSDAYSGNVSLRAYRWALMKTITSFSKGWFPLFIVNHFDELQRPDVNYVQRHLDNKDKLILL